MSELQPSVSGRRRIRGILLDLDGVVHVRGKALPGSLDAIARVRAENIPLKFVTNTTRVPRRRIVEDLAQMGLQVTIDDVFTPAISARAFLLRENWAPFLVAHPDLREDFAGLPEQGREAVVLGDAGTYFTYDTLNDAFRKILGGAEFLALANNRNFLDRDGELSLDLGAFVAALEYASSRKALVLGKPSSLFFALAVDSLGCAAEDVAMIGDDVEADVGGARAAGLMGILVQTGKYRAGQEKELDPPPTFVAQNLADAVNFLLS
ncbi:TIGR01458 family HAD-type hydrolase [Candidatus Rhodoblastus alkanivorans]|uniref:Haloacid dehalogenase-like hydrolase domain-containing protein 2 n=1 Tax=Candidatus Rhodoblastus alkanivorans TaxID=2954117 RepID=A0ABS9ZDM8_9HYPH|nr:TIGR01458 family HAD-type hydrolase [Candidatus Rhodoblastus alkanivorans]MCI4684916.1 TIGR01458 family HAD-type hydrolase [Candidatus Rhodoblastus alkanivorans]